MEIIGRQREWRKLEKCMEDNTPQLVIVNGRRRVGKTYLINHFFRNKYAFQITGGQNYSKENGLKAFARQLSVYSGSPCPTPKDWDEAFWSLEDYLSTRSEDEKLRCHGWRNLLRSLCLLSSHSGETGQNSMIILFSLPVAV